MQKCSHTAWQSYYCTICIRLVAWVDNEWNMCWAVGCTEEFCSAVTGPQHHYMALPIDRLYRWAVKMCSCVDHQLCRLHMHFASLVNGFCDAFWDNFSWCKRYASESLSA